jgi:hypothetical protein
MRARNWPVWGLLLSCLWAGEAGATVITNITNLYSTGVDNSHNPLPNLSSDPHYTLVSQYGGSPNVTPLVFTVFDDPLSLGPGEAPNSWIGNSAPLPPPHASVTVNSRWIGQEDTHIGAFGAVPPPASNGIFVYQTTFTIPVPFISAQVEGYWSADNLGLDIVLNGTSLGLTTLGSLGDQAYEGWSYFNITSGFSVGINTLQFVIRNTANSPEGLRVQIVSATYVDPIPEPASLALLGSGLVGLVFLRRRTRATVQ